MAEQRCGGGGHGSDLYPAYDGTNYLALSSGLMTTTIPTVIGQPYSLTYAYRGPGLVDWWPFEGDASDIIGTNDGMHHRPSPMSRGEVGQGFQFNGTNFPESTSEPTPAISAPMISLLIIG